MSSVDYEGQMDDIAKPVSAILEPPDVVIEKEEEYAYGFIMEVLTRGLYPIKLHVVREYVQNAYDAILDLKRQGKHTGDSRIEIKVSPPSIFIFDNGIGMDSKRIAEYRYVGYSRKLTAESVGFRGIGKLSGLSAAGKIIVTTSQLGVPEQYQLVFDAEAMIKHVESLKETGENIALNQLIRTYTSLTTSEEDPDAHYTQVELYQIRQDSNELIDESKLIEYLSLTAPVDFAPDFQYGSQIDQWLRDYVRDYDTVPLFINGKRVYKPFLDKTKPPQQIFVEPENATDDLDGEARPIAFAWYCEHEDKGQFPDEQRRGLVFRVKNFAVGDNQLSRIQLWRSSPERAFYFIGEIHVCDPEVIPSADRTNFEQNSTREQLYKQGSIAISRRLNRVAGTSSDQRRAIEFVTQAEQTVGEVSRDVDDGKVPTELRIPKIVELSKAAENVQKRLVNVPQPYQERGKKVVGDAQLLIQRLDGSTADAKPRSAVYDIKDELKLGQEGRWVYETIIAVLSEVFGNKPEVYEKLISEIHKKLRREGN